MFVEVKDGAMVGEFFNLTGQTYITQGGEKIWGVETLSKTEKIAYGIFEIIENIPTYDSTYQFLSNPTYTVLADGVELRYDIQNNTAIYPQLVEQRLSDFAKQKDIDIKEVEILKQSTNPVWVQEATTFSGLYNATWQTYYEIVSSDWREIESLLPALIW